MGNSGKEGTVRVHFPCVHGLANGQLVTINCFPAEELKGTIKVVTGADETIAKRIIGASRFNESDSRAAMGVIASFSNPLFSGESYGLALAIADKLARFDAILEWSELYATGSIPSDGCGRVAAIKGFTEKLDLLIEKAKPGSLFVYPERNLSSTSQAINEKITILRENGVECVAISTIKDLQGNLWESGADKKDKTIFETFSKGLTRVPVTLRQTILGLILIGLAGFFLYLVIWVPSENSILKSNNQYSETKKNNSSEVNKEFSHQEIVQEERISTPITQTSSSPSGKPANDSGFMNETEDTGKQHPVLILESTDTDSSLY